MLALPMTVDPDDRPDVADDDPDEDSNEPDGIDEPEEDEDDDVEPEVVEAEIVDGAEAAGALPVKIGKAAKRGATGASIAKKDPEHGVPWRCL